MQKTDYAAAGVDQESGDSASSAAYQNAQRTFPSRKNRIGEPVKLAGGFAGALDFGDFYLVQNDDGTGSKSEIAEKIQKYDTLGRDLVAMVADDAVCVGAEVVSITNTFDVPAIEKTALAQMSAGLADACIEQKIVIPGGEIAQLPDGVKKIIWNATAVGVVRKERFLTGEKVASGQKIVGLFDPMMRSNGFSLARKILEQKLGNDWAHQKREDGKSWGETLLTPSKIFHRLILDEILGDFDGHLAGGKKRIEVSALCHITGGGLSGNVPRILGANLGARFDALHEPATAICQIADWGQVDEKECYRTWHCGTGFLIFCDENDAETVCERLNQADSEVAAKVVGTVIDQPQIEIVSQFSGKKLVF